MCVLIARLFHEYMFPLPFPLGLLLQSFFLFSLASATVTRNTIVDTLAAFVPFLRASAIGLERSSVHWLILRSRSSVLARRRSLRHGNRPTSSSIPSRATSVVSPWSLPVSGTRHEFRHSLVLVTIARAFMRAKRSSQQLKLNEPNRTPTKRDVTRGSKLRHSERHAVRPSPGPALTTWSSCSAYHQQDEHQLFACLTRFVVYKRCIDDWALCLLSLRHQLRKSLVTRFCARLSRLTIWTPFPPAGKAFS